MSQSFFYFIKRFSFFWNIGDDIETWCVKTEEQSPLRFFLQIAIDKAHDDVAAVNRLDDEKNAESDLCCIYIWMTKPN